jgi:hypothetical protein
MFAYILNHHDLCLPIFLVRVHLTDYEFNQYLIRKTFPLCTGLIDNSWPMTSKIETELFSNTVNCSYCRHYTQGVVRHREVQI